MNKTYIAAAVTLAFFTMNPALAANGYDVRSLSSSSYTDRNESVSNDEYLTKFSEGIQGVDIGICLKGADRMKKESKLYNVSFALSADALKIKNATNTGVQQLFAQSVLGHEGAEEIDISAKNTVFIFHVCQRWMPLRTTSLSKLLMTRGLHRASVSSKVVLAHGRLINRMNILE